VLASALGALGDRLDSKFLTAYWLPAFVAVLGGFGILALLVGAEQIDAWIMNLDSVEQTLAVILIVLAITMAAFVLRALSRPIVKMFAGDALPRAVATWSTRGQLAGKYKAAQELGDDADRPESVALRQRKATWLSQAFPRDDDNVQPTLLGNVLATAAEHPRVAYMIEGFLWWPRLSPLVPVEFQEMLSETQSPMIALLNLSVIFAGLALGGAPILALAGGNLTAALIVLAGGLLLSRLCYRAAVSQAVELGNRLRVGFDLYRHEILRQLNLEIPADFEEERALWQKLTAEMLGLPGDRASPGEERDVEAAKGEATTS
jgi:hypothetical protein